MHSQTLHRCHSDIYSVCECIGTVYTCMNWKEAFNTTIYWLHKNNSLYWICPPSPVHHLNYIPFSIYVNKIHTKMILSILNVIIKSPKQSLGDLLFLLRFLFLLLLSLPNNIGRLIVFAPFLIIKSPKQRLETDCFCSVSYYY